MAPHLEPTFPLDQALFDAVQDQANREFIAAWLAWRGRGQLLPKRSEMNLGNIKHLLGRVILLEVRADNDILVRVAGSQLREHGNFEATGKNMRDVTQVVHDTNTFDHDFRRVISKPFDRQLAELLPGAVGRPLHWSKKGGLRWPNKSTSSNTA